MTIRDLPAEDRPRERLARHGAAALSSVELIAILLRTGSKKRSALQIASDLLTHFETVEKLSEATLEEIKQIKGIGFAKAVQLQAAFSLFKRVPFRSAEKVCIDSPEKAFSELALLGEEKSEVLAVLLRDTRRNLIHKEIISRGTINQVLMHPREVYHVAIRHRAHSLIVAHNHPSGDPSPSTSDLEMTHHLRSAGGVIGIPLADHLIIGQGTFFSFRQKGLLDLPKESGY
jgi:DNA repair protein RadC